MTVFYIRSKADLQGLDLQYPAVLKLCQHEQRSHAQNRLYWKWLTQWGNYNGISKDEAHYFFKYRYLIAIYMRDDADFNAMCHAIRHYKQMAGETEQFKAMRDGVIKQTSTVKASVEQMSEYLTAIHAFCLKQGCQLTIPDELKWCL